MLSGTVQATVDGQAGQAAAGDVILVPAGAQFGVDNLADEPATAWVTTSVGFHGVLRQTAVDHPALDALTTLYDHQLDAGAALPRARP